MNVQHIAVPETGKDYSSTGSAVKSVRADLHLTHGGAAENLDWLSSDAQVPAMFNWTAAARGAGRHFFCVPR
jgi:hypothetical protein